MQYFSDDTIIALSTPFGKGAISVVRISGKNTLEILSKIASKSEVSFTGYNIEEIKKKPRYLFRSFFFVESQPVDDGLFAFFPAPHSYTGEDVAELYLHGNPIISKTIIRFLSATGLARPALPGEFTRRAFLNGKIDLTKAEAIHRLITAKNEVEWIAARRMYFGDLYRWIQRLRSDIILLKAQIEAEIDFSDQEIDYSEKEALIASTQRIIQQIENLLQRSHKLKALSQGLQIALVGRTNAGKSSLMNRLLGWDRSIVSDVEGTTRDYIAEEVEIAGTTVRLVDTAGLRNTSDAIEKEGIRRSKDIMARSKILIYVIDGSVESYDFFPEIQEYIAKDNNNDNVKKVIFVINKKDILHPGAWNYEKLKSLTGDPHVIMVSCKTGEGIEELYRTIENFVKEDLPEDSLLLEERQIYHLLRIKESLEKAVALWYQNTSEEIVALEIQQALDNIAELTGEITTEEILGRIFSMFCIGK